MWPPPCASISGAASHHCLAPPCEPTAATTSALLAMLRGRLAPPAPGTSSLGPNSIWSSTDAGLRRRPEPALPSSAGEFAHQIPSPAYSISPNTSTRHTDASIKARYCPSSAAAHNKHPSSVCFSVRPSAEMELRFGATKGTFAGRATTDASRRSWTACPRLRSDRQLW